MHFFNLEVFFSHSFLTFTPSSFFLLYYYYYSYSEEVGADSGEPEELGEEY